jgi:tripartite ATP-independent transporter DctP family solute receptor
MSRRGVVGALAAGTALVAGCAPQGLGQRTLLAADSQPEDYPTAAGVRAMGERLTELSGGRFDVRLYAGGQLGSESDTLEITTFGGLDLNRVHLAPLNAIEPLTMIPSLPFIFRSKAHMRRALDGAPGDAILEALTPKHMVGLCFYDSGERCFYTARRPVSAPQDLKGLKVRVPNSELYIAMIRALGADPTPMPLGDVYQSLVTGVIDGAENNLPSYEATRHFEAAPNFALSGHMMTPDLIVMSASRWGKLTEEERGWVRTAARDSVGVMRQLWDEREAGARARLEAAGVAFTQVDGAAFAALTQPVWERFLTTPLHRRLVAEIAALGETA